MNINPIRCISGNFSQTVIEFLLIFFLISLTVYDASKCTKEKGKQLPRTGVPLSIILLTFPCARVNFFALHLTCLFQASFI